MAPAGAAPGGTALDSIRCAMAPAPRPVAPARHPRPPRPPALMRGGLALLGAAAALLPALGAAPARAETRAGAAVVVGDADVVEGNLYAFGRSVVVHGTITGDLVAVAASVVVDGHVEGDVVAAGGELTLAGLVDGDVRAAGARVAVAGPVGGDAAAAGPELSVSGDVGGDALVAGNARVDGDVAGGVRGGLGRLEIDGTVGRGVVAADLGGRRARLVIGPEAVVHGDVRMSGSERVHRAAGAVVSGRVIEQMTPLQRLAPAGVVVGWLQGLTGVFLLGLLWLGVSRGFAHRAIRTLRARPAASLGVGAAVVVAAPVGVALLLAAGAVVGGWWLALFLGGFLALAVALTLPLVAAAVARAVCARAHIAVRTTWIPMAAGLLALFALLEVPVAGALLAIGVVLFGLGALTMALVPTLKRARAWS